jgi:hypothetical protein
MATRFTRAPLAGHRNDSRSLRDSIVIHHAPVADRLSAGDRKTAFLALYADAKRKPDDVYEISRAEPRCVLPDEKQRAMIHRDIRAGLIPRDRLLAYRRAQLLDDLSQYPDSAPATEVLHVELMTQTAEMVHACTVAEGMPTLANRRAKVKETRDVLALAAIVCAEAASARA